MLGLWMYQWDSTAWSGVAVPDPPQPPGPPAPNSNAGGGHYDPLGDDYWMAREGYLTRDEQVADYAPAAREDGPLQATQEADSITRSIAERYDALNRELQRVTMEASTAVDAAQKMASAKLAMKLAIDISKLRKQYYERARSIRLFDVL